jgi:hypothetical protein
MNIQRLADRLRALHTSDLLPSYVNRFANRLTTALRAEYDRHTNEPETVKVVQNVVNHVNDIRERGAGMSLATNAVFIHGQPSYVQFSYYGSNVRRELGDLIFISSLVFNGEKQFERLSICQFKKDSRRDENWDLSNSEQLYLLSRFPTFLGVAGSLIPPRDINLTDTSGGLGSYGLLFSPGDFAFVGAPRLSSFIGGANRLGRRELYGMDSLETMRHTERQIAWTDLAWLARALGPFTIPPQWHFLAKIGFDNRIFAGNVFDFVEQYVLLSIGEPIYASYGPFTANRPAMRFLRELLQAARTKAARDGDQAVVDFVDRYVSVRLGGVNADGDHADAHNNNVEPEITGGGIGIVHLVVNIGE